MHTTNAALTIQRLIAMFPPAERDLLLLQLETNLEAVISQRLAKARQGGRLPVVEIMRATPMVRKLIGEGHMERLPQAIANRDAGMQLFDQHLADSTTASRSAARRRCDWPPTQRRWPPPCAVSLAVKHRAD